MRKARELIGLNVLTVEDGRQVGQVKDVLLDSTWNLQGVVLEAKMWFSAIRYIRWSDIVAAGDDAVTITNDSVIREFEEDAQLHALLEGSRCIKGLPVVTAGGCKLGVVEDVYFDPNWGTQVVGYELSEGFLSDLKDGRKWLPMPATATKGADAIIVPVHCIEAVEELFVSKEE